MSISATRLKLEQFGQLIVENAQRELGAYKPRKSFRAKWKNGKLVSFTTSIKRRRSDNTGALRNSINYTITETQKGYMLNISSLDYGIYVNEGRLPGKGIPKRDLMQYIRQKPIRPQKQGGGFLPKTQSNLESLAFLINRKIKTFGIESNPFLDNTIEKFEPRLVSELEEAYAIDIADQIRENVGRL